MSSECYGVGYGNRLERVLIELAIDWLARDVACGSHGFEESPATGEEGFLGSEARAESALRVLYDAVFASPILAHSLAYGRGYRQGSRLPGGGISPGDWEIEGGSFD